MAFLAGPRRARSKAALFFGKIRALTVFGAQAGSLLPSCPDFLSMTLPAPVHADMPARACVVRKVFAQEQSAGQVHMPYPRRGRRHWFHRRSWHTCRGCTSWESIRAGDVGGQGRAAAVDACSRFPLLLLLAAFFRCVPQSKFDKKWEAVGFGTAVEAFV